MTGGPRKDGMQMGLFRRSMAVMKPASVWSTEHIWMQTDSAP